MNIRHFFAATVAVALGGCQICTDCEPVDYVLDSTDTIYQYSSYSDDDSAVFAEDEVWTDGEVLTDNAAPLLDYVPSYTASSSSSYYYSPPQTYRPWRNIGRQRPYSGPRFTTPPMQPIPYPTETYYPFKRPSPGAYMPWRNTMRPTYYPNYSVPTYRSRPYFY